MSGLEVFLLLGGFTAGAIVALVLRYLLRNKADNGTITVSSATCVGPNQLQIGGQFTNIDGNVLIKLYTLINADASTSPQSNGAMAHDPPASGTQFSLLHQQSTAVPTSGTVVVWGLFGKNHAGQLAYQCGSGSGTTFKIGQAVSEPSARQYRLKVGPDTSSELRLALPRGEVILTFDPLRAAGEAVWSEETPAGEPARWRLTVRKAEGTHVAALELVNGAGPAIVWLCRQWHFFAGNRFVADPAHAGQNSPSLEVQPA